MMFCPGCAKKDSVPVLETVDKLKGVQTVTACSQKCKIAAALDQSCDYFTWKVFAQLNVSNTESMKYLIREGIKKNRLFLGKSPKLWVGGGQES